MWFKIDERNNTLAQILLTQPYGWNEFESREQKKEHFPHKKNKLLNFHYEIALPDSWRLRRLFLFALDSPVKRKTV